MDKNAEEIYNANLQRMKKFNNKFADFLENAEIESCDNKLNIEYVEGKDITLRINGIQLTSRHDRILQLEHMCQKLDLKFDEVDVYGFGLGDVIQYLNKEFANFKLIKIHILNLELFQFLMTIINFDFDLPNVKFVYDEDFITVFPNNLIFYPEVLLADRKNRRLAEHLEGYLDLDFCAKNFDKNKADISENIICNRGLILSDPDISEIFGKYSNKTAIVVGSGPSLKNSVEHLKMLRKKSDYVFLTADTALNFLHSVGIQTDYLVSIDHLIDKKILGTEVGADEILAYSPSVKNELCLLFDRRFVFYCSGKLYEKCEKEKHHTTIYSSGSVIHNTVDLACRFGARNVILFGCDFAFLDNCSHARAENISENDVNLYDPEQKTCKVEGYDGRMLTTIKNFRYYLHDLEYYISKHTDVTFFNASKTGAIIRGAKRYEIS